MIRAFAKGGEGGEATILKFNNLISNVSKESYEDTEFPVSNYSNLQNNIYLGDNKFAITERVNNAFRLSIFDRYNKTIQIYDRNDIIYPLSYLKMVLRGRMLHFINGNKGNTVHKAFDLDTKEWLDLAYPPIGMLYYENYVPFGLVDSSIEDELIVVAPQIENAIIVSGLVYRYTYKFSTNSWEKSSPKSFNGNYFTLCRLGDYIYMPQYVASGKTRTVVPVRMACSDSESRLFSYGPSISLSSGSSYFNIQGYYKRDQDNGLYFIFINLDNEGYYFHTMYYIDLTKHVISAAWHDRGSNGFKEISGDKEYLYSGYQKAQQFVRIKEKRPLQEVLLPMTCECEFDKPSKYSYLSTEYDNPVNQKFIVPKGSKLLFTTNGTSGECVAINEE